MSNKRKGNTFSKKIPGRKMNIAKILNKPIILSNKYIIEINELRKIEDNDDIPDAIAYGLSLKIKKFRIPGKEGKVK